MSEKIPDDIAHVLVDPSAYADDRIHDAYRWLRANNPVGRAEVSGFDPFWVVTRHADILDISKRNALFHNGDRSTTLTRQIDDARVRKITGTPHFVRSLVQMDAPDHPKYRALTFKWFSPGSVKKLEDDIRALARQEVDRMAAMDGRCDFMADVAIGYPLHVIMNILGVPMADKPRMLRLTQDIFGSQDIDKEAKNRKLEKLPGFLYSLLVKAFLADFTKYFMKIAKDRRTNPQGDLASVIANAVIDGQPISDREATGYFTIVATAGHDTTSSSLAGGMGVLAHSPDLLARLKADPSLIPAFVEEAIRWTTPVKTFMRTATEDTDFAGRRIARGDWLMLCYASGNRDEAVFDAPFEFRLDRKPNKQLAFGYGAHVCIGQHLARLELKSFFEELLPRIERVDLEGEMQFTHSWFVNGPRRLPLRLAMS
ncbi:cytochrome P450 [Sphingopyxis sp.]|uniref:cytochrome P450 n=1 Tax=Sphingopyxis sp. TaxID=1908224 RepID=UPI002ED7F693